MTLSPKTPQECLDHALQCERLAAKSSTGENRTALLEMAATWRALATDYDKNPQRA